MAKGFILLLPVLAVLAIVGGIALLLIVSGGIVLDLVGVEGVYILLALFGLLLLVRVGIWLWQSVGVARAKVRAEELRAQFIAPDERGLLPVHAGLLMQPQFGAAAMTIHAAMQPGGRAAMQQLPQQPMAALPAAAAPNPQSFAELYQAKQLPSKGFLIGYNLDEGGEAITADWGELYSSLVGGLSGMGKTTLIRSILAQSALQGGRFVVVDPHYDSGEESLGASLMPLRPLMLCDIASNDKQIMDALAYVGAIGRKRLQGQDKERWPLILVVEETTALFQRSAASEMLTDVLGQIAQETRKVGVYAVCVGQDFRAEVMPAGIRNCFVSMISMRTRRDTARVQSGNNTFAKMAETLDIGQCVWMAPRGGLHRLAVPNCTAFDLDLVARQIPATNTQPTANRALPLVEASAKASAKASADDEDNGPIDVDSAPAPALDARTIRVLEMMATGATQTDIIAEVWGVTGKGNDYKKASAEYREIMSSAAKRIIGR